VDGGSLHVIGINFPFVAGDLLAKPLIPFRFQSRPAPTLFRGEVEAAIIGWIFVSNVLNWQDQFSPQLGKKASEITVAL
jgi:hypothetical protein